MCACARAGGEVEVEVEVEGREGECQADSMLSAQSAMGLFLRTLRS